MEKVLRALQARQLDKIAAAYAVAGWVLVQAASIALPTFDAPAWVLRAFIIFLVIGFPLALGAGWLATPHLPGGVKATHHPLKRVHLTAFAVLVVVIALSTGELAYILSRARSAAPAPAPAPVATAPSRASIAVLPFVNMSGDASKEYFSDGISEELLNDLANTPDLQVAARTSSFAFKGKNEDIKTIAHILAVRAVLEGSVRESGAHIRITAQLIDAASGYHLWSAIYDRSLTDVLALQDEIARAITLALTHKLLPSRDVSPNKIAPIDPEAYRDYLLGQQEFRPREAAHTVKAVALFERATLRAPSFAEGFAALGRAYIGMAEDHPDRHDLMPAAEAALKRALALDPKCVSALGAHLDLALHRQDWTTASDDARRLIAISPHSQAVLHEMFRYYQLLGFPDLALAAARGAAALDPLSFVDRLNVADALIHNGRFADAAVAAQSALALTHDDVYVQGQLCTAYAHSGQVPAARAIAAKFAKSHDDDNAKACLFDIAVGEGRLVDAIGIADQFAAHYPANAMSAAEIGDYYATAGDTAQAVAWLTRACDAKDFVLFAIPFDKGIKQGFFDQPQWKPLMQRSLFKDWTAAHDRLTTELATGSLAH